MVCYVQNKKLVSCDGWSIELNRYPVVHSSDADIQLDFLFCNYTIYFIKSAGAL